ncbi:monovalent cation/H+ antiporter complex subunit F [Agaribacter flavus]|uniref:Monovalent cation/H+ antiporter complex subunit F n=1 Tax=Agaribacter flavus TaxID=1902781 RepID=A0ABV7FYR4_9ALTE
MTIYFLTAAGAVLITMALALCRALLGPSVFDRILAVNMFGTKAVLLVAIFAFFTGRHDLLDIALLYSLLNFVGVIAALRLVERGKYFAYSKRDNTIDTEEK